MLEAFDRLSKSSRVILVAGAGGGYDVLGAVPLVTQLRALGKTVHLASLTFALAGELPARELVTELPQLFRVTPSSASEEVYCPEAWLSSWYSTQDLVEPIWCFEKTGVQPLREAYAHVVSLLGVDTIILVDGGVDAILRGDEASLGTPAEDLCSLAAVSSLPSVTGMVACIGFGAELRDGISHSQVLERIAELTRGGHFLGACSVSTATPAGSAYQSALRYVLAHQQHVRRSHVQAVINAALDGAFGTTLPETWVSPLSSLFWFFTVEGLASSHLFLNDLRDTRSLWEVNSLIDGFRKSLHPRPASPIPL